MSASIITKFMSALAGFSPDMQLHTTLGTLFAPSVPRAVLGRDFPDGLGSLVSYLLFDKVVRLSRRTLRMNPVPRVRRLATYWTGFPTTFSNRRPVTSLTHW